MATDAALLNMARNALLVAGHEMGSEGDHWPVIKAAVHGLARAYETMKLEEEVASQLRQHMQHALDEYEQIVADHGDDLTPEQKRELEKFIGDMRDIYSARFEVPANDDGLADLIRMAHGTPGMIPFQRAAAIIRTLNEEQH